MSKTPSKPDPNANPVFELFKKCKRFKHFKLYAGVLGFVFASISVICCFFYLDYRAAVATPGILSRVFLFHFEKISGATVNTGQN